MLILLSIKRLKLIRTTVFFDKAGEVNIQDISGKPTDFGHTKSKPQKVFFGWSSSGETCGFKFYQNQTSIGEECYNLVRFRCLPALKEINGDSPAEMWPKVHRTKRVLNKNLVPRMLVLNFLQG